MSEPTQQQPSATSSPNFGDELPSLLNTLAEKLKEALSLSKDLYDLTSEKAKAMYEKCKEGTDIWVEYIKTDSGEVCKGDPDACQTFEEMSKPVIPDEHVSSDDWPGHHYSLVRQPKHWYNPYRKAFMEARTTYGKILGILKAKSGATSAKAMPAKGPAKEDCQGAMADDKADGCPVGDKDSQDFSENEEGSQNRTRSSSLGSSASSGVSDSRSGQSIKSEQSSGV